MNLGAKTRHGCLDPFRLSSTQAAKDRLCSRKAELRARPGLDQGYLTFNCYVTGRRSDHWV